MSNVEHPSASERGFRVLKEGLNGHSEEA